MATDIRDRPLISVAEIATNGNIVLVVGPNEKKIKVSSFILQNASNFFKAMFSPHFSESQDLCGNSPKEISMPDDDANALEIICNVIHLRNDAVPETLNSSQVFEVAVAADKLDCVVALKHASTLWLNPQNVEDIVELGYLMAAAYVLDNARAFNEITLSMILCHKASYLPLTDTELGLIEFVPWKAFYLLEERRSEMRTELQQILLDATMDAGTDGGSQCTCGWSSRHCMAYMQHLRDHNLLPSDMLNITMSRVVETLEDMDDPTPPRTWAPCDYRWHKNPGYRKMRGWRLDRFKKSNGVCIDCVKSSSTATPRQICRIKH